MDGERRRGAPGRGALIFCSRFLYSCIHNLDIHILCVLLKEKTKKTHTHQRQNSKKEADFDLLFWTEYLGLLSKFVCWFLTLNVMVLGGEAFQMWLGHEGRVLMSGISALIKETPECSLAPTWGYKKKMPSVIHKRALTRSEPLWYSDFQRPRLW